MGLAHGALCYSKQFLLIFYFDVKKREVEREREEFPSTGSFSNKNQKSRTQCKDSQSPKHVSHHALPSQARVSEQVDGESVECGPEPGVLMMGCGHLNSCAKRLHHCV